MLVSVVFGLISAAGAVISWFIHYDTRFRLDSMERKLNSINGKFGRWEQEMRSEIMQTVEGMEFTSDTEDSGFTEMMQRMMLAQMFGANGEMVHGTDHEGPETDSGRQPFRWSDAEDAERTAPDSAEG
jgi:hypothetical protein